ncbi:YrzI family protein [Neobacillus piezotolerans]|uniref:YrzI family protein n=1 Tax=Neobacillus piezotolerans TaxID=2259171 RepID=A0A3D8GJL7_9BACI|nr:YrzI family small protein [Neobacillus piezotolerans]RDU34650.1 YrzI family protein [Neobacillus piezotolerans]
MTLQLFLLTITIKKRNYRPEELIAMEHARRINEENKARALNLYRPL